MTQDVIAEIIGVGRSYVSELINDPTGERARDRKSRAGGTCIDCGAPTSYATGGPSRRCRRCRKLIEQSEPYRLSRQHFTHDLIIERIREWAERYGEPPGEADWNPLQARANNDEERAKRFEDANGYWPWMTVVYRRFPSWNAAIEAAGFTPRKPYATYANMRRHRRVRRSA